MDKFTIVTSGWTMRINKETGETWCLNTNLDPFGAWWVKVEEPKGEAMKDPKCEKERIRNQSEDEFAVEQNEGLDDDK